MNFQWIVIKKCPINRILITRYRWKRWLKSRVNQGIWKGGYRRKSVFIFAKQVRTRRKLAVRLLGKKIIKWLGYWGHRRYQMSSRFRGVLYFLGKKIETVFKNRRVKKFQRNFWLKRAVKRYVRCLQLLKYLDQLHFRKLFMKLIVVKRVFKVFKKQQIGKKVIYKLTRRFSKIRVKTILVYNKGVHSLIRFYYYNLCNLYSLMLIKQYKMVAFNLKIGNFVYILKKVPNYYRLIFYKILVTQSSERVWYNTMHMFYRFFGRRYKGVRKNYLKHVQKYNFFYKRLKGFSRVVGQTPKYYLKRTTASFLKLKHIHFRHAIRSRYQLRKVKIVLSYLLPKIYSTIKLPTLILLIRKRHIINRKLILTNPVFA